MSLNSKAFVSGLSGAVLLSLLSITGCGGGSQNPPPPAPTVSQTGTGSTGSGTGTQGGSGSTGSGSGSTGTGSGSGGSGTGGSGTGGSTGGSSSTAGPVILVLEENHGYSSVIGNSAMPYLNSLAQQYGLATQYYANTHPSIGNYMELTTGQIITNDDSFDGPVSNDNIVRHLNSAGKSWKAYAESLPYAGYTGGDSGAYLHRHNPLSYFTDVVNDPNQAANVVPFTQFASDLAGGHLPNFSFVAPNANDDAHDGTLAQADTWLQANIAPVLATPRFQQNGLLVVVFDEAEDTDSTNGGGHVSMVVVGPRVKPGARSSNLYQHQNLLKMVTTYLGIDGNLGDAASASAMSEFLN